MTGIQSSDPHRNLTRFKNFESVAITARWHVHCKRMWTIAVATFKTYRFLRLTAPPDEEVALGACCPRGLRPPAEHPSRMAEVARAQ